ncbi:hypothetical protein Taro_050283 [Colocasia esculenta]|uniref:Uncharacterized protein n=1 Tax=Colocasia esculenta TaxID=4460 RepID=A0A843XDE5_COLES|nr:hypothetical protein [Colocasia esculenta]
MAGLAWGTREDRRFLLRLPAPPSRSSRGHRAPPPRSPADSSNYLPWFTPNRFPWRWPSSPSPLSSHKGKEKPHQIRQRRRGGGRRSRSILFHRNFCDPTTLPGAHQLQHLTPNPTRLITVGYGIGIGGEEFSCTYGDGAVEVVSADVEDADQSLAGKQGRRDAPGEGVVIQEHR